MTEPGKDRDPLSTYARVLWLLGGIVLFIVVAGLLQTYGGV